MSSQPTVCFRPSVDFRHALASYCEANGITISELIRTAVIQFMGGDPAYSAIKQQAYNMARALLMRAREGIPDTYEEAEAHGLLILPGQESHFNDQ